MSGPLTAVRVIDMTGALMGPFATQIMGDLGAEVVKVEAPQGDTTRWIGPARSAGMGPLFLHLNRSKRSVVIDLKKPEGRAILLRLTAQADVLIYNLRPPAMARLGLTYGEVAAVNPRIIYCGVCGFGQDGPYAAKPAYDDTVQGAAALPWLEAQRGGGPRYVPTAVIDRTAGLVAVYAVLAALLHRERTGEGQAVEVPMFESMAQFILSDHMYGRTFEPPLGEAGYPRLLAADRRPYATKDGHICVLIYTDKHWNRLFDVIGRSDLKADQRFTDLHRRTRHIEELYRFLAETLATRTTAEWLDAFDEADIPAMPLHTLESLMADPHLREVGFFKTIDHPTEGGIRTMAVVPSRWSKSAPSVTRQAPRLGEHTPEVLGEAGYAPSEIARLLSEGIITDGGGASRNGPRGEAG